MRLAMAACLALFVLAHEGFAADPSAFAGRWNCDLAEFRFAAEHFTNGAEHLTISDLVQAGSGFVLSFEDNDPLILALNPDGKLSWFSPLFG